ncbi:hypothetical protein [Cellulomonas sp. Y8]|uniref:hypothetical protein n=1 Tax=Cellulomonas sp. Y8 TaxID=2591145 RepID=UPI0011CB5212|nr:hypothetical protein [Cellulomonas sp. Y8]
MRLARRLAPRLAAIAVAAALTGTGLAASAGAADPDPDRLALSVVGDGATTGNVAVPVAIQLLDGEGVLGGSIALPTAADAGTGQHAFTLGADRDQQGALQQSADHRYVTLGGYDAAPGTAAVNDADAPGLLRVAALVGADGSVDTSTTLADGFSKRHVRGVVTADGSTLWAGGHGNDAPTTKGGVLAVPRGGDAPTAVVSGSSTLNNARVPVIHDGQLYVSSDRSGFSGVSAVGTGLPTTGGAAQTLVAAAPAGSDVAHDFTFVGDDLLYVTYTEGTSPGLAKYVRDGAAWTYVGSYAGAFWGVTGRVAGDDVVLYAVRGALQGNEAVRLIDTGDATFDVAQERTIAQAAPGTAFRGVAFAPGYVPGTDAVDPGEELPTLAWDVRVAGGTGNALSAVVGDPANPAATGTVADPLGEDVTLTATSGDAAVLADSAIRLTTAAGGRFTLTATPTAAGRAPITVTATTADGRTATSVLDYWVSAALADPTAAAYVGMSDASAAYDVGDGYFLAGDDDSNQIRLFAPAGGEPVAEFDVQAQVAPGDPSRPDDAWDIEAAARVGDTIYWVGSLGNTNSGNVRPARDVVVATRVHGSGAATTLEYVGSAHGIRQALVDWDAADGHGLGADHFGFTAATRPGTSARGPHSLNLEGATIAPDGTTLWLGFRSPIITGADGVERAVVIGVRDIAGVVAGTATPQIGEPVLLDLDGLAIRDMERTGDGRYLILAGGSDEEGEFTLFGWNGDPADAPVRSAALPSLAGWDGSYEGIVSASSLADGTVVRLLQDAGEVDIYGTGTVAQELPSPELKKFVGHDYALDLGAVFTPKSVTLPGGATTLRVGEPVDLALAGFAAGERVSVVLNSDPVTLATVVAGADGRAVARVVVPASVPAGAHTLVVSAVSGEARLGVTVLPAAAGDDGTVDPGAGSGAGAASGTGGGAGSTASGAGGRLAVTGADLAAPLALAGLLLVGGGATVLAVRRRTAAQVAARAEDATA